MFSFFFQVSSQGHITFMSSRQYYKHQVLYRNSLTHKKRTKEENNLRTYTGIYIYMYIYFFFSLCIHLSPKIVVYKVRTQYNREFKYCQNKAQHRTTQLIFNFAKINERENKKDDTPKTPREQMYKSYRHIFFVFVLYDEGGQHTENVSEIIR